MHKISYRDSVLYLQRGHAVMSLFRDVTIELYARFQSLPLYYLWFYYTIQVNLGGDILQIVLSRTPSASRVDTLQIISVKDSVNFKHQYSPNHHHWGLNQLQALIFWDPLIALLPNVINRKGRAPGQLQASIFRPFGQPRHQTQSTERGGPSSIDILQHLIGSLPNATDRKGKAPGQLRALKFFDPLIASPPNVFDRRERAPRHLQASIFSQPFDSLTTKCSELRASIFFDRLIALLPNVIDRKGRAPWHLQALIFSWSKSVDWGLGQLQA